MNHCPKLSAQELLSGVVRGRSPLTGGGWACQPRSGCVQFQNRLDNYQALKMVNGGDTKLKSWAIWRKSSKNVKQWPKGYVQSLIDVGEKYCALSNNKNTQSPNSQLNKSPQFRHSDFVCFNLQTF